MARLLCVLVLGAACAAAQSVEGSVFDAATGAGIGGVKVELLKGGTPFYETATDGGGRFRFDSVREGDYAARYQSPDYWLTAGPSDYRYFHVAAGDPVKLEVRLIPWSKISGRVVDGRGNGVANARLEMTGAGMVANGRTYLRTSWGGGGGGQLMPSPSGMSFSQTTDAQGRFAVQVMPGSYGFSVRPPPELKPPPPEQDGPARVWTRTWYPGVAQVEGASKIVVLPGGEIANVELKLLAVPARLVRGLVLNPDGTPAPKLKVSRGEPFTVTSVESKSDGTFEFAAVAEGESHFWAEAERGSVKLRATEWIEVKGHDLENVKLRLAPPVTLRGRVIMPELADAASPRLLPLLLTLVEGRSPRDDDPGPLGLVMINPNATGDFTTQDAYPGVYRLWRMVQPPPAPYYLDAVRIGSADLAAADVEISSDSIISVIYKTDGGSVAGKAENCAAGGVLLMPRDPAQRRPGFSKSGPCDANDHYEVRAVRPGDYYAVAFAGNGPVVTVDEAILNQAVKVTVRAGEASSADLKAATRPVY
jgi:hypothetical protein